MCGITMKVKRMYKTEQSESAAAYEPGCPNERRTGRRGERCSSAVVEQRW